MDDRRRQFLTLTAFGLALAVPARALAQPQRILREATSEPPGRRAPTSCRRDRSPRSHVSAVIQ
jgi:hypothetical protein